MSRIRVMVIGLVAVLVISGATAATVSAAAPEFGRCAKVAKATGKFSSASCTFEAAGGSFEWLAGPGANNKFTITTVSSTFITFEWVGGTKITCKAGTAAGEYTGLKTVRLAGTFTGCASSGCAAQSKGQPEGVILLNELEGRLGIEKKGEITRKDVVGLDLAPTGEGLFVEFSVCGLPITIRGSVISAPLSKNRMLLSTTMKFTERKGKQKPESFEAEPRDVLESNTNGGPFEQSGLQWETNQTNEEPIEINSVF